MESMHGRVSHPRFIQHVDRTRRIAAAFAVLLAFGLLPARTLARVLLIGDSITEGAVSGTPGVPYADVVATDLGPGFDVLNLGCGGAS